MCNDNVTPRKTKNEFSYAQKVQERELNHYPLRSSECFWEKRCPFLILRTRGNRQDEWTSDVDAMMMICTLLLMPIPPPFTVAFWGHILWHQKDENATKNWWKTVIEDDYSPQNLPCFCSKSLEEEDIWLQNVVNFLAHVRRIACLHAHIQAKWVVVVRIT